MTKPSFSLNGSTPTNPSAIPHTPSAIIHVTEPLMKASNRVCLAHAASVSANDKAVSKEGCNWRREMILDRRIIYGPLIGC